MSNHDDPVDDIPDGARALARLQASRQRLRRELLPDVDRPGLGEAGGGPALPRRLRAMFRHWRYRLRHAPLAGMALTAFQTWWHEHPLRVPGEALGTELRSAVVPMVRRHPVATVLIAGAAGAALVAWRPWRWPVVARQIKPIPRGFGRWVMRQLSQPAVQTMLAAWLMSAVGRGAAETDPEDDLPHGGADSTSAPASEPGSTQATAAPVSGAADAMARPRATAGPAAPPFGAPATQAPPMPQAASQTSTKPPAPADSSIAATSA